MFNFHLLRARQRPSASRLRGGAPRVALVALLALSAWLCPAATARNAASLPPDFVLQHILGVPGLITSIAFSPDGRMFIGQKEGAIRVFHNGQLLAEPFADLSAQVNNYLDRGLMGVAVHPEFPSQPYVYAYFAYDPPSVPPDTGGARVARVLRLQAEPGNLNKASTAPEARVIVVGSNSTLENIGDIDNPNNLDTPSCFANAAFVRDCVASDADVHIAGKLAFAPDGAMLVSTGDASTYLLADPRAIRALDPNSLNGKVLRINPLSGAGLSDNPFFDGDPDSNRSKVLYSGLRNAFRFAIQPSTGQVYIGDVGWNAWEELNTGPPGSNFGWPCYEGGVGASLPQPAFAADPKTAAVCAALYAHGALSATAPLFAYDHSGNMGAAIVSGAFYSGTAYPPAFQSSLFFMDYSQRWIKSAQIGQAGAMTISDFAQLQNSPLDIAVGANGDLFIAVLEPNGGGSSVYRLRHQDDDGGALVAMASASPTYGPTPLTVQFSSEGSFDPDLRPLGFVWEFGDGGMVVQANPQHTYVTSGTFTATLTAVNQFGDTAIAHVQIRPGALPPILTIAQPLSGTRYASGDVIAFAASARTAQGQSLDGQISWSGYLHHNEHVHYDFFTHVGPTTTLTMPDHGDDAWVEVCARVQDDDNLQTRACVNLVPRTVEYRLDTSPSGLSVQFDGVAYVAPVTLTTVVSGVRNISVAAQQGCYTFERWWDGKTIPSRDIVIASADQVLSASFRNAMCGSIGTTLYLPMAAQR